MADDKPHQGSEENRVHPRVRLNAEFQVSGPRGITTAVLKDLSRGGASFVSSEDVGDSGATLELFLPGDGGAEITVMAEIVRSTPSAAGFEVSVRFSLIEPSQRAALDAQIENLVRSGGGGGGRKHPRIARRIGVRCQTPDDLRAIVEDISKGGVAMTVPHALVLNEELTLTLPDNRGDDLLSLRARVIHQRGMPQPNNGLVFRIGFEFVNMVPVRRACLSAYLQSLVEAGGEFMNKG